MDHLTEQLAARTAERDRVLRQLAALHQAMCEEMRSNGAMLSRHLTVVLQQSALLIDACAAQEVPSTPSASGADAAQPEAHRQGTGLAACSDGSSDATTAPHYSSSKPAPAAALCLNSRTFLTLAPSLAPALSPPDAVIEMPDALEMCAVGDKVTPEGLRIVTVASCKAASERDPAMMFHVS